MNNIRTLLSEIDVRDLIKLFNIQIAVAIFLIFFIFRGLFSKIILKVIFWITKHDKKVKDSKAYKILSNFFIFLGLYCALRMLKLTPKSLVVVNAIFKAVCIIFVTNMINSNITRDSKWFVKYISHSKNEIVNNFICKIIRGIIWIVSFYIILNLQEWQIDLTGLVAGFGVGSVIISLAAQDTVKSLLSGAVIMTDKPFDIGDFIEVNNYKGNVIDITFRSTRIKAVDNSIITIPNSTITAETVVNWAKLPNRRLEFVLNLSMETNSEKIKNIVEKLKLILTNHPKVLSETVQVSLDAISSYSSDVKIFLYIDETNYINFLTVKEKIYCEILNLLEMENIELAYPTQTVYVKNNTENKETEE